MATSFRLAVGDKMGVDGELWAKSDSQDGGKHNVLPDEQQHLG